MMQMQGMKSRSGNSESTEVVFVHLLLKVIHIASIIHFHCFSFNLEFQHIQKQKPLLYFFHVPDRVIIYCSYIYIQTFCFLVFFHTDFGIGLMTLEQLMRKQIRHQQEPGKHWNLTPSGCWESFWHHVLKLAWRMRCHVERGPQTPTICSSS